MNQPSSTDKITEQIAYAVGMLAHFAKELGPQYWDLNPQFKDSTLPRLIVIAIVSSDNNIEAAIKSIYSIRMRQMSKSKAHKQRRAEYHDSKLSDSEE